ncbi:5775_t:CDS:2 [Ambispora leptoticha]|uniref:5775_t:CDS:1 n=1 Tax=Ambispora leptoticha TaxID=144679 RepID=A0A9N8V5M5_9GLOM|nr:5775_t:CDS:2 [Ambispora leptoticha]
MLKPKVISQVLQQATTGGVKATLLLNSEGSPLVFVSEAGDRDARVYAAIASNVWSTFEKNTKPLTKEDPTIGSGVGSGNGGGINNALKFLLVECEEGNLAITTVTNMLLCLVARTDVALGILKAKTDALARHLEEPFQRVSTYTQSSS